MAKQKMKYTNEELNAMRINAMLQGLDPSEIQNEPLEDDDIEIEIEDETPKTKKRGTKKVEEKHVYKKPEVPMRPEFEKINKCGKINVTFGEHDIHYKEQYWGIPTRIVEYNVELVTHPKLAVDCSNILNNKSEAEAAKASSGEVRYFKVITYDNVLAKAKEIGYIKVMSDKGKLKHRILINKAQLKELHINADKLMKNIQNEIRQMLNKQGV